MSIRVDGRKIWQFICLGRNGEWEGYYTNGIGCEKHKARAEDWAGCMGGELKVHCLKRGVTIDSVEMMLRKCMTQLAYRDALDCKMINGRVVTAKQASYEILFRRMEKKGSWVDITKGMTKKKKAAYLAQMKAQESGRVESELGPDNREALNFDD